IMMGTPWLEPPEDASGSLQQARNSDCHAGQASSSGHKRQTEVDGSTNKETGNKRTKATIAGDNFSDVS
ncbi:hypothetical protein BGW38_001873, partial [Lunasporangiospora selenospora]